MHFGLYRVRASSVHDFISVHSRVGFLPRQKVFLPGHWKKPVKTGNKFSTLSWMEILGCNYNASLKLR